MATRIIITAEADQAKREAAAVAAGLERIGTEAAGAASETKSAADRIERELEQVADEAKSTGRSIDAIAGSAEQITAVATSFTAMVVGLKAGAEAAKKAYEGIRFLAENGNQDMARLVDAISGDGPGSLKGALLAVASDPAVGQAADGVAFFFRSISAELETIINDMRRFGNNVELFVSNPLASIGLGSEEAAEKLRKARAEFEMLLGMERRRAAEEEVRSRAVQQRSELEEQLEDIARQRAEQEQRQAAEREGDVRRLSSMILEEKDRLIELAEQAKLTNEERAKGLNKIISLEQSLANAERANAEQRSQQREREASEVEESARAWLEHVRLKHQGLVEELKAEREAAEARARERERQRQEQRAEIERQKEQLADAGAAGKIIDAASDPRAVAQRLSQMRAREAWEAARERGESLRESQRAAEQARRQAFRQAQRQFQGGRREFSEEEIRQAQEQNLNAQFQQMKESGKFSRETLAALAKATAEQRAQAEEMRAMQDTLREIQRQINATVQDGTRRRAQRGSNRQ